MLHALPSPKEKHPEIEVIAPTMLCMDYVADEQKNDHMSQHRLKVSFNKPAEQPSTDIPMKGSISDSQ